MIKFWITKIFQYVKGLLKKKSQGIPKDIYTVVDRETFANPTVLDFYKVLPFNFYSSIEKQADSVVKGRSNIEANPPLIPLLEKAQRVLDVGCGAGWLTNTIAYNYPCQVTGIDFNLVAVERAQAVAQHLGLSSQIMEYDLVKFVPEEKFDLVISLGVIHHTDNCLGAIRHLLRHVLASNGKMYIGLYHKYGREPFLSYFEKLKTEKRDENYLFEKYKELHSSLNNGTHLLSWFRDQVLHPHETQHTLEEVAGLLENEGAKLVSTSINKFQPFEDPKKLFEMKKNYSQLGRDSLAKRRYFPGFFTFLIQKN